MDRHLEMSYDEKFSVVKLSNLPAKFRKFKKRTIEDKKEARSAKNQKIESGVDESKTSENDLSSVDLVVDESSKEREIDLDDPTDPVNALQPYPDDY